MKRPGGLWDTLVGFDNLWLAWRKTRAGKAHRPGVAAFELDLEAHLLRLQRELIDGRYRPGRYRLFTIYERKPRVIAAAPLRDRVVHHAVMNRIEAPLDRRFIPDSYACRIGKGVHAAVDRYQHWAQRYAYVLKLDIRQYFPSIDHAILKAALRQRIKDRRVLALLDVIIDGSPPSEIPRAADRPNPPLTKGGGEAGGIFRVGIPIGNLTSQFFANLYLDDFDHWVKEQLGVPAYLRYVDDMVLLADDKGRLAEWRAAIRERLQEIRLRLHPDKAHITPTAAGINLLGYQVRPRHRRLANHNGYRFRRRLRRFARLYRQRLIDRGDIDASVRAWIGHAIHADTEGLRRALFDGVHFRRFPDKHVPAAPDSANSPPWQGGDTEGVSSPDGATKRPPPNLPLGKGDELFRNSPYGCGGRGAGDHESGSRSRREGSAE